MLFGLPRPAAHTQRLAHDSKVFYVGRRDRYTRSGTRPRGRPPNGSVPQTMI